MTALSDLGTRYPLLSTLCWGLLLASMFGGVSWAFLEMTGVRTSPFGVGAAVFGSYLMGRSDEKRSPRRERAKASALPRDVSDKSTALRGHVDQRPAGGSLKAAGPQEND